MRFPLGGVGRKRRKTRKDAREGSKPIFPCETKSGLLGQWSPGAICASPMQRDNHPEKRVLIAVVDDDEPFRKALHDLLHALGYKADCFGSVVDFVNAGAMTRTDCLILDISMPDLDGFALQGCLRGTNYDIPIIFCSGVTDEAAKQRALTNGAVTFLEKPVKAAMLLAAIRAACPG